jgi:hypothetical protein
MEMLDRSKDFRGELLRIMSQFSQCGVEPRKHAGSRPNALEHPPSVQPWRSISFDSTKLRPPGDLYKSNLAVPACISHVDVFFERHDANSGVASAVAEAAVESKKGRGVVAFRLLTSWLAIYYSHALPRWASFWLRRNNPGRTRSGACRRNRFCAGRRCHRTCGGHVWWRCCGLGTASGRSRRCGRGLA